MDKEHDSHQNVLDQQMQEGSRPSVLSLEQMQEVSARVIKKMASISITPKAPREPSKRFKPQQSLDASVQLDGQA